MRVFYFIILVVLVTPLVIFGVQNQQPTAIRFLDQSVPDQPLYVVVGAVYLLGMLSGSTLVGFLRRSFARVTESRESHA